MIGARLGKWVVDKELGRGGMGRVYLAHEAPDGGQAALKVLAAELAQESGFLHRFQREIEVLSQLSHPNIVRFYESGSQEGFFFYAMEYVEGDNFEQLLQQQGRLPWKEVLDAALQVCPALKHAHDRGIVHRDLKPPNLLRTPAGVVKLTDFGIAKLFASRHLTHTGGVVGTAEFLSPEQAAGKQATKRSDLYSLGAVLYTLLAGRPPFQGQSSAELLHKHLYSQFDRPIKILPDLPHDLDEIICQLLEKDPSRRPADGLVLHRQLDSIRRKLDRKSNLTHVEPTNERTVADNLSDTPRPNEAGPATLMSQLMRNELERQNRDSTLSQWLNRPWVLLPLFVLCVGLIIWSLRSRPVPPMDTLMEEGRRLMSSSEPSDWEKARSTSFEPLNRDYPDHPYKEEVEGYLRQIDDHAALRKALASTRSAGSVSEAQRLYRRGLRLCQDGDGPAARQVWQDVVRVFRDIPSEERWVRLAEAGLTGLNDKASTEARETALQKAVARARQLQQQGKAEEADAVWSGLAELYKDDASARAFLEKARRDPKP
jgi:serine/threonine-protein kinase